jgi:O-antigen ligase
VDVVVLVVLVAALPAVVGLAVVSGRDPLGVVLPAYAATVPFGSGLAVPGLPTSLFSASSLAGLVLTAVLMARLALGRRGPARVPAAVVAWLVFAAVAGTSVYWSISTSSTVQAYAITCSLIALYAAVRLSAVDATVLRRLEAGILVGGTAAAAYGLYQYATGTLVVGVGGDVRFGRDLTDPNHLAATLLLPLTLSLSRAGAATRVWLRLLYGGIAALVLIAIVLTGSRGGVLGVLAVFAVLALTSVHRVRVLATGGAVLAVLAVLVVSVPSAVNDRLLDEGSSGRTGIWKVGLAGCPEYCLAGAGWGTFGKVYDEYLSRTSGAKALRDREMGSHNVYLGTAVELGMAGLLMLVVALALCLREAVVLPKAVRGPPLAALCGLLFTTMLLGNLRFKYFWLVLIYVGVCHAVHAARPAGSVEPAPAGRR